MRVLAVIPARGGSKGIKNKNLSYVGDKHLLQISIEQAKKSKQISKLIVSTDSKKIAKEAKFFGAEVPFLRPKKLALDSSLSVDVVIHAINYYSNVKKEKFDAVLMLQPTSPFRTHKHISKAIKNFKKGSNKFDSLVSVVDVDGNHPFRMKKIIENKLINYIDQGFWDMRPRQNLPKVYIRNGSIYIIKVEALMKLKSLISNSCYAFEMSKNESINIDDINDLKLANFLYAEK